MMKRRKRALGGMMMGMGKGMMSPTPTPSVHPLPQPPSTQNPILLLNTFPALSETSIVDQDTTVLPITTGGIISRGHNVPGNLLTGSNFTIVVNIVIYAPNAVIDPMAVFDSTVSNDTGGVGRNRLYNRVFQYGFGKSLNAYQHAMFYLNGIPPFTGKLYITVKHPPCRRRIVTVDQFANMALGVATDQLTARQSPAQGVVQIASGLTNQTTTPFQLVYGSIAIGRSFDQYQDPQNFIPIQSVGSDIDSFDAALKTYYQVTATQDQYGISALVSDTNGTLGNFVWSAAAQTFKAIAL